MSDIVQLPPVNSDTDNQSTLSIKPVRPSASQSDSNEFNKVLTKQSDKLDKNSDATKAATYGNNSADEPTDSDTQLTDDSSVTETLAVGGNTSDTSGNSLPADVATGEPLETLQVEDLPILLSPTSDVDAELPETTASIVADDNLVSGHAGSIDVLPAAADTEIDTTAESGLPASPVIITANTETATQPVIPGSQARVPENVQRFLATQLSTSVEQQGNREKSIGFIETSPGLSNAIDKQPVLPTQSNAVLRSFLKTTADQTESPVANIRLRDGAEPVQRTLLFEQLTGLGSALRQPATQAASSLLNFTATTPGPVDAEVPVTAQTDTSSVRSVLQPVALTNTETGLTTGTSTVRPALELPLPHSQWGQELGNKVSWLINHRLSEAQIRLNPQELGPVEVRIQIHQDSATVNFSTHNQGVKESIESAIPRLREALAEQGLDLVDVNVSQQDAGGEHGEQPSFFAEAGAGKDAPIAAIDNPDEQIFSADLSQTDERIDFYV